MFLLKVMCMWYQQKLHKDMLKVLVNMEFSVTVLFGTECIITIEFYLGPGKPLSGENTSYLFSKFLIPMSCWASYSHSVNTGKFPVHIKTYLWLYVLLLWVFNSNSFNCRLFPVWVSDENSNFKAQEKSLSLWAQLLSCVSVCLSWRHFPTASKVLRTFDLRERWNGKSSVSTSNVSYFSHCCD